MLSLPLGERTWTKGLTTTWITFQELDVIKPVNSIQAVFSDAVQHQKVYVKSTF